MKSLLSDFQFIFKHSLREIIRTFVNIDDIRIFVNIDQNSLVFEYWLENIIQILVQYVSIFE